MTVKFSSYLGCVIGLSTGWCLVNIFTHVWNVDLVVGMIFGVLTCTVQNWLLSKRKS